MTKREQCLLTLSLALALAVGVPHSAAAMHIAEGYLPAGDCVFWGALCLPFVAWGLIKIRRLARSIERRRYRTLHTTMPLPRKVFLAASTQYWLRYGQRFGTSRRQMETMQIEA